ncbi:MAG: response regulator, partial [Iodobacter sp.]
MPIQERSFGQSIALRLRLAFGVVAATTLLASGAALWAFHSADTTYSVVSGQSFPAAIASARLEASSLEFSSALASLANAQTISSRENALARARSALADLPEQIKVLAPGRIDDAKKLMALLGELGRNVPQTDELVSRQLRLDDRKNQILLHTGDAQQRFLQAIDPVLMAKNADLLSATRRASVSAGVSVHSLIDTEFSELHGLQQARAEAFRLAALAAVPGGGAERTALLASIQTHLRQAGPQATEAAKTLAAALQAGPQQTARAMAAFDAVLLPLINQITIQMISRSDQITLDSTNAVVVLVAEQVASLSAVQRFRGDVVLLASLIAQAANTQSAIRLNETERSLISTSIEAKKTLNEINDPANFKKLKNELYGLISLSDAEDGIFAVSREKMRINNELQQLVMKNQNAAQRLVAQAQFTEKVLKQELNTEMQSLSQRFKTSTLLLAGLTLFSLLVSLGIGSVYIRKRISSRLVQLSENMQSIADGHFDVDIDNRGQDEISVMAQSLLFFRDASILLRARSEELIHSRDQAEAALQVKGDFLANMSHEIRTPLTAILGYTHLLLETSLVNRQRDYLNKVQSSANLLLGVINDILDISKIEAGKLKLEEAPFDLYLLLENLASVAAIQAENKKLKFIYTIDINAPQWLMGDSLRLGQILLNLINNAVKFTSEGEVELAVSCMAKEDDQTELKFSIYDTGIGISPDALSRLFNPFIQEDSSTTRRFGGSGLGLAISQQLAHIMGGNIVVTSQLEKGSVFHFTLSLKNNGRASLSVPQYAGSRVILAEAHAATRMQLCLYLKQMGMQVKEVCSFAELITCMQKSQGADFDLLIMDSDLMDQVHPETIQGIWYHHEKMATVLLTTVLNHDEIMARWGRQARISALSKPIIPALFYAAVHHRSDKKIASSDSANAYIENKSEPLLGMRILLAEDTPLLSEMSAALLSSLGAKVDAVENGKKVVELIFEQHKTYDVVLMDVQMPEMDGMEATRLLRTRLSARDLPVIALTAHAMDTERQRCLDAGMNEHLAKP